MPHVRAEVWFGLLVTENPVPAETPHIREAKRAAARTSAIFLMVVWLLAAALLIFDAISAHSHGHSPSAFFWIGLVALVLFTGSIVSAWRRLSTRYPKP
jgi:drug/metabolite transporter (DMT)-like permease